MKAIEYFNSTFIGISHGNSTYVEHANRIYQILKDMNCSEEVCLAGLYHSVYGTENYQLPISSSRPKIKELIGEYAERLVTIFCGLTNRTNAILNNTIGFDNTIKLDLLYIEYANLKEQLERMGSNTQLESACNLLLNEINITKNYRQTYEKHILNNKSIYVFDNILQDYNMEWIHNFCLESNYTPGHRSNGINPDMDSRFSCTLNEGDLNRLNLLPSVYVAMDKIGFKLDIVNAYINHYGIGTSVSKHTDASDKNMYTILVFCNKYWEHAWGGEIVFYNEQDSAHLSFEYKPGRILLFDSRLSHKVMPLTTISRSDRYTIAIKCKVNENV